MRYTLKLFHPCFSASNGKLDFFSIWYEIIFAIWIPSAKKTSRLGCLLLVKGLKFLLLFGLVWQYCTNQNQYNKGRFKVMATLSIGNWVVLYSGMLLYHSMIFFHPAKFDNFKDETISDFKTVSVPQSQILAGLKTLGQVGLWATF